jgi:protein TonB
MGLKRAAIICVIASAAMHIGAVTQIVVPDAGLAAASPPPALVSAGNSFADMVMGAPATSPPDPIEPREVEDMSSKEPPPNTTQTAVPTQIVPTAAGIELAPDDITDGVADVQATIFAPTTLAAIQPTAISPTAPVQPQTIDALPEVIVNDVTSDTVRPPDRPVNLGQVPPPPSPRQPTRQRATLTPSSGGAQQDTTRGTETPTAPTSQQTTQGQGNQADQAAIVAARQAAASYGNQVYRRLERTRRENTRMRGVAIISFTIGTSGQLTTLTVQRSSGNADLDRIASNHVRRSAPFAPPPSGAPRVVSFEFLIN